MSDTTTGPPATEQPVEPPARKPVWQRREVLLPIAFVVVVVVLASVGNEQIRFRVDVTASGDTTFDWAFFWALFPEMLKGLFVTARATVLGFGLAVVLGLVLALGRRSPLRVISWPTAAFIEFVRSTPLLVQLYFLFFGLPDMGVRLSATQVLIIGLGVHYATYASEGYRAGIESVPKGQWEAATAMNLGPVTTWQHVILPQALPNVLPSLGNNLVAAFKDAPLGFAVGVTGILFFATTMRGSTFRAVEPFLVTGIGFLLVSLPAAWFVRRLERRLDYERI